MDTHQAPNIVAPCVWIGDAAHASRYGVKAIRHALNTGGLKLLGDTDRTPGGFRRFAPVDVLRLAVMGRLVSYGFTMAEAAGVLERTLDRTLFGVVAFREFPAPLLASHLRGYCIQVVRDGASVESLDGPRIGPREHAVIVDVGRAAEDVQRRSAELARRRAGAPAVPADPAPRRRTPFPARTSDGAREAAGQRTAARAAGGENASRGNAAGPRTPSTTAAHDMAASKEPL